MTISLILVAVTALGLLGTLALFVSLKRDIAQRSRKQGGQVDAILARLKEAEVRLAPSSVPLQPSYQGPRFSLNLSKRVQVMRLLRQGEDIRHIAELLDLPRGEVQLLASVEFAKGGGKSKAAGAD